MTTKNIEDVVAESNKRLMAFEHEPSYWNGIMVYEAGDIDGYYEWLTTTLTQLVKEVKAGEQQRVMDMVRYYSKDAWSEVWDCINAGVEPYDWDNMTDEEKRKALRPPTSDVIEK